MYFRQDWVFVIVILCFLGLNFSYADANANQSLVNNNTVSIVSISANDQEGNQVSTFARGSNGFVKLVLSSPTQQSALITVDLVGSDLTSLGVGSIQDIMSQAASEVTLSFYIPKEAKNGTASIFVDVYSDWPDNGGVPLTNESSLAVKIGDFMEPLKNNTTVTPSSLPIPKNSTILPVVKSCQNGTTSVNGICYPTVECPQTYSSNYYTWNGINCIYKYSLTVPLRTDLPWGSSPTCQDSRYSYNGTACVITNRVACPFGGWFINSTTCLVQPVKKDCQPYFTNTAYGFPLYSPDHTTGVCTIDYNPVITTESYSVGQIIGASQYNITQIKPDSITVQYHNVTCYALCYSGNPYILTKVFTLGNSFASGTGCGSAKVEYATLVSTSGNTAIFSMSRAPKLMSSCPVCLSADTQIDTPFGKVNVKDIHDGNIVWSLDSNHNKVQSKVIKINNVFVGNTHKVIDLQLVDGRELFVSPNHPTYNYRTIASLKVGENYDGSTVKSVELVPYKYQLTYDILPDSQTGDYWADGILVGSTLK